MSGVSSLPLPPVVPVRFPDQGKGLLMMAVAITLLSVMDLVVKFASETLPTVQIAWGRYVSQTLVLIAITGMAGLRACAATRMPGVHVMRALLLFIANIAFMLALRYLPLTEANVIGFASPLLLTALAWPVLGERVGAHRWAAVVLGFSGVLIVMRPGTELFQWAVLLPLLMAVAAAVYHVTTPLVRRSEDPAITIYFVGVIGAALTGAVLPWSWTPPDAMGWAMLAAVGFLATTGHLLMIRAFALAPAAALAPFFYIYLIWALIFGFFVFGDVPDHFTLIGAALVVASGVYVYRTR